MDNPITKILFAYIILKLFLNEILKIILKVFLVAPWRIFENRKLVNPGN